MTHDDSSHRTRARAARRKRHGEGRHQEVGDVVVPRTLAVITGASIALPDPAHLVHLQFRRFAGCPVCNLHLRSITARHDEIVAAGIREVIVFHSSAEELLVHAADLPFDVVGDPQRELYTEFGVETTPRALLDPRAWWPLARGAVHDMWGMLRGQNLPSAHDGVLGVPADLLIAPDGRVVAAKYGVHSADQWSVDELLAAAATVESPTG